jgi:hypothetical protein
MRFSILALSATLAASDHAPLPCEVIPVTSPTEPVQPIIGGDEIVPHSRPYLLSVGGRNNGQDVHFCGASFISPHAVMTAANCLVTQVSGQSPQWNPPEWVDFNRHDRNSRDGFVRRQIFDRRFLPNSDAIIHPGYNPSMTFNGGPADNDVAILFLSQAITDQDVPGIKPVTLNLNPNVPQECGPLDVAGWGFFSNQGGAFSDVPLATTLNYYNRDACTKAPIMWSDSEITDKMLCAGAAGNGTCYGDAGE